MNLRPKINGEVLRYVLLGMLIFNSPVIANEDYSPYAKQSHPENVYWGDTHLHSNLSMDANSWGNKKLTPADAYKFARGDTVLAHNGMKVKLRRPLDFLVVADHAENLGVLARAYKEDPLLLKTEFGRKIIEGVSELEKKPNTDSSDILYFASGFGEIKEPEFRQSVWQDITSTADNYNDPGKFTAFIGYEWSGSWPIFGNLHRIVIFKDNAAKANQKLPFSQYDSKNPEDLWHYLAAYQKKTGGDAFAIPHNSNLSNGYMFSMKDVDGKPLDKAYAALRSRWEPLLEVTQMKGDSEAHPSLSPKDEFADFETWDSWLGRPVTDEVNEKGRFGEYARSVIKPGKKQYEYARSALKVGLAQKSNLGVNPFKFGMIGSTDAHTSLSTADDDNFWGKMSIGEPSAKRIFGGDQVIRAPWSDYASSGYAAVWATENTREAIFDAMKRKEVYATTGPRMTVRFFGGWDYQANDAFRHDLAHIGYSKGVPIGGDLTHAPKNQAPRFLIRATKDPDSANLDRVQIIKGWRDGEGALHEKIYNVALSDNRIAGTDGKVPPVGNTVDVKNATYVNSIGEAELAVMWVDPDFNADQLAFYYVRVLEIPTPRWTAYDAKYFNLKNISDNIPMITQERAYSSPIWYTP